MIVTLSSPLYSTQDLTVVLGFKYGSYHPASVKKLYILYNTLELSLLHKKCGLTAIKHVANHSEVWNLSYSKTDI